MVTGRLAEMRDIADMYDNIVNDDREHGLESLESNGATPEQLTQAVIRRVIELRVYPACERMTKLNGLRSFVMTYMGYGHSMLARRVIASELLEIGCLPSEQRAYAKLYLAEALGIDELDTAIGLWRDCVADATEHGHTHVAEIASRHLEPMH